MDCQNNCKAKRILVLMGDDIGQYIERYPELKNGSFIPMHIIEDTRLIFLLSEENGDIEYILQDNDYYCECTKIRMLHSLYFRYHRKLSLKTGEAIDAWLEEKDYMFPVPYFMKKTAFSLDYPPFSF